DRREFDELVRRGDRGVAGPHLNLERNFVAVGAGVAPAQGAEVLLVRFDPRVVNVPIRRGENGGRTLPHRNVVKELVILGTWT
ncbi:DUF1223 domain-containing protein, partial [Pseudomonas sp. MPR-AND1A]|uniref:DUF1223 domain-containing protein n=1 Tax=Pseudomonas sp. MPR-AND1A TaxID=2070600 RepID=UPI000CCADA1B